MNLNQQSRAVAWGIDLRRYWGLIGVFVVLLMLAAVRIRLATMPLERDEGEYAYAGQLMLQGIPPYRLAYNMKFPGTYAAYAVMMALFGQSPSGIRLGLVLVTSATTLLLYWTGRKLLDEVGGMAAATAYAVLAASPMMLGLFGHATHFCALFAVAGLWILCGCGPVRNGSSPSRASSAEDLPAEEAAPSPSHWVVAWPKLALGGVLFGLATLMKQHAAIFCVWGLVFLLTNGFSAHRFPVATKVRSCVLFSIGCVLPFCVTCVVLWRFGVLGTFWFWTIRYARQYASINPVGWIPKTAYNAFVWVTYQSMSLWVVGLAGLVLIWFDRRLAGKRFAILAFSLAAFLTVWPGFYFRTHYFLLMAPAVGLLAGVAMSAAGWICRERTARWWPRVLLVTLYFCVLAGAFIENRDIWFQAGPIDAVRRIYPDLPFVEVQAAADFIGTNSAPEARIVTLSSEPQIYFLSQRHSVTGYIYAYPLMERQSFASQMEQNMEHEIEAGRPDYVVIANSNPAASNTVAWWNLYRTNFTLDAMIVKEAKPSPQDSPAEVRKKLLRDAVFVYRRK